jgi:hypothetical protein
MIDKNGKEIFADSLVKFCPHNVGEYWISKIDAIFYKKDISDYVLVLCKEWHRNPHEVEVVTPEEAMLLILEHPTGNHHV